MKRFSLWCGLIWLLTVCGAGAASIPLTDLGLDRIVQGYGEPRANQSVDRKPLTIAGKTFGTGLGTHSDMQWRLVLDGKAVRLKARVGLDDETLPDKGSVEFRVVGDGRTLFESGVMHTGDPAREVDVALAGITNLLLVVTEGPDDNQYDHANWAEAVIEYGGVAPVAGAGVVEEAVVLTPKPKPTPRINGARIVGVRPGSPFLFTVPVTGDRPMKYAATGLPPGLTLNSDTGVITGSVKEKGEHRVKLTASNARGKATRDLRIVVGDKLALTPPMGWNSWNCFAGAVTAQHVKDAADAFVKAGLREHGWTYINIDDYWQVKPSAKDDPTLQGPERDAQGRISPNPRFPDMKGLADYVHGLGLKIGLYSSPGPLTCGGCVGSFEHEEQDAQSYAEWGFDYLKYDWCSYSPAAEAKRQEKEHPDRPAKRWTAADSKTSEAYQLPYRRMHEALAKQKRDIVYSLCQYGMGNVWEWGSEVGGHCWRTTGDIVDTWRSMSSIGFGQAGHEIYHGPGAWGDPDMLVVGQVGWGPRLHPTRLTPNEQYTHISLWSLLASPLLIGCDMTKLDEFTLNLLTNDEVIEVNQDPLGRQARRVAKQGDIEVWSRFLEDGSRAVGLFNRGDDEMEVKVAWPQIEVKGPQRVRDLWRQKDIGTFPDGYRARIPRHGVLFLKVTPAGG
jgi:alpha-galactosidase